MTEPITANELAFLRAYLQDSAGQRWVSSDLARSFMGKLIAKIDWQQEFIAALAARVAAQSELLSKRAEEGKCPE